MGLTRKMLAAMEISEEKIGEIMNAHLATLNEIKDERDQLKADKEKLEKAEKDLEKAKQDLEKANQEIEKYKSDDWESKYNTVKGEYDTYKKDTETKAIKTAKESAYKKLLLEAGVSDKRIDSIMKLSGEAVDKVELDDDGKIKDSDKLTESVKKEWADFIVDTHPQGANVSNPPANDGEGGKQQSRAAQMVAQYRNEHYGNPKED